MGNSPTTFAIYSFCTFPASIYKNRFHIMASMGGFDQHKLFAEIIKIQNKKMLLLQKK